VFKRNAQCKACRGGHKSGKTEVEEEGKEESKCRVCAETLKGKGVKRRRISGCECGTVAKATRKAALPSSLSSSPSCSLSLGGEHEREQQRAGERRRRSAVGASVRGQDLATDCASRRSREGESADTGPTRSPNRGRGGSRSSDGQTDSHDEDFIFGVRSIKDMRVKGQGKKEFLVSWEEYGTEWDTWEPASGIDAPQAIEDFWASDQGSKRRRSPPISSPPSSPHRNV
jgi:hypothetical protein